METRGSCSTGAAKGGARWSERRPVLRSMVSDTLGKRPGPSDGLQVGEDWPDVAVGLTQWPVKAVWGASALACDQNR